MQSMLLRCHTRFSSTGVQQLLRMVKSAVVGALVFIDPQANVRKRDPYVPVWLIRGLEKGWRKAISVSRDFLTLVPFATVATQEVVEGSQRTLFEEFQ